jgi:hypothetical protein
MKKTTKSIYKIIVLLQIALISSIARTQITHNNITDARDCYYTLYFSKSWKPLFIKEGKVLRNGEYKWVEQNESAFKHSFCDYDTAFYYRFIFLRKSELQSYINNGETNISENKDFADFHTVYIKGQGTIGDSKRQFFGQRCTFMGLNSRGEDSISTQGVRYWVEKNGLCSKQEYFRTYKEYELISGVIGNGEDCDKQNRGYWYSWSKDHQEIMHVFSSKVNKAFFIRRPDNNQCIAAYFIFGNNSTFYEPKVHWVVGDYKYLLERFYGGDPVHANGNSNETGDFLKAYWRDYPGTLFFPFHLTSLWNSTTPDTKLWLKVPVLDEKQKLQLEQNWNDPTINKTFGGIADQFGKEYLDNGGYWSAKFSKSGSDCNTLLFEDIH